MGRSSSTRSREATRTWSPVDRERRLPLERPDRQQRRRRQRAGGARRPPAWLQRLRHRHGLPVRAARIRAASPPNRAARGTLRLPARVALARTARGVLALLALAAGGPGIATRATAATPLIEIRVSPDVTVTHGATVVGHEGVVRDDLRARGPRRRSEPCRARPTWTPTTAFPTARRSSPSTPPSPYRAA